MVAIDYMLRSSMIFSALIISEKVSRRIGAAGSKQATTNQHRPLKASAVAKIMKSVASLVMLALVAHCWLCVFSYYDDNNGKISK